MGGESISFNLDLGMTMVGTGDLNGFFADIDMTGMSAVIHTAPRTSHDVAQFFDQDFYTLSGYVDADADFNTIQVTAGTSHGMPSPGSAKLMLIKPGEGYCVDSFFDITYQIDFVGNTGGYLEGLSGTTQDTVSVVQTSSK